MKDALSQNHPIEETLLLVVIEMLLHTLVELVFCESAELADNDSLYLCFVESDFEERAEKEQSVDVSVLGRK